MKHKRMARLALIQAVLAACLILIALSGCKCNKPEALGPLDREPVSAAPVTKEIVTLQDAAEAYEAGATGADLDKAVALFRQHSFGNIPQAQYYLGRAHYDGRGAQQSRLEAYYWWTVSARNGYIDSMDRIEDVEETFSVPDQEEIENRANDWLEHVRSTPEMN